MADEEVQAVRLLHDALNDVPMDYALLDCQAAFCLSKGEGEMAVECAKQSVTAAPSEFSTWARLAEVYVSLEQWDLALLTLNSCPMFTHQDKDAPRLPQPSRILLPILQETMLEEIEDGSKEGEPQDIVHPTLRKLHAGNYQGTFLKAYTILTKIAAAIGWDQLLRIRSEVFVMEEEYRVEKQVSGRSTKNASTSALHETSSTDGDVNGNGNGSTLAASKEDAEESEDDKEADTDEQTGGRGIEKPSQTMASEVVKSGGEDVSPPFSFQRCYLRLTPAFSTA
jgi:ribosomal protein L12E/L44/L45/RPP1/RPP2